MSAVDIHCPKCSWKPSLRSRWVCSKSIGGCGKIWNTFHTRGVCPQCSWKWEITQCLKCKQYSLHEHWYHYPDADPSKLEEEETEFADA